MILHLVVLSLLLRILGCWTNGEVLEVSEVPEVPEVAEVKGANQTVGDVSDVRNVNATRKLVTCRRGLSFSAVELMNASRLTEVLTPESKLGRTSEARCVAVLFYSPRCPFSGLAAPQFNALARIFPDLKMGAVDSVRHGRVNTQFGIVGVPSLILFHNARAVAKFNGSEYSIRAFADFLNSHTGIEEEVGAVHAEDFRGPVPSAADEDVDRILLAAWLFVALVNLYYFSGTRIWKAAVETVKNTWREAEAQHEHAE